MSHERPYKRKAILLEIESRLEAILKTNGYDTDAGKYLFHGPVQLGLGDTPLAIAIVAGPTITQPLSDQPDGPRKVTLPIEIQAVARDDIDHPLLVVESMIGDIKRAIETNDFHLRKLVRDFDAGEVTPYPRSVGSTTVGAVVEYRAVYLEFWGDPEVPEGWDGS